MNGMLTTWLHGVMSRDLIPANGTPVNAIIKAMSVSMVVTLGLALMAGAAEPPKSEPGGWVNLALGCPVAVKTPNKEAPQGKGRFAAADLFKEKFADKTAGIVGWGSRATPQLYVNPGIEELSLLKGAIKVPARGAVVHPGPDTDVVDGAHFGDTTFVEFVITEVSGEKRVWDLAKDVVADIQAANPHADSMGNAGVWHFLAPKAGASTGVKAAGGPYATVKTVTNQVNPGIAPLVLPVPNQKARFVKIAVSCVSEPPPGESTYALRLAEVEVLGPGARAPEKAVSIAPQQHGRLQTDDTAVTLTVMDNRPPIWDWKNPRAGWNGLPAPAAIPLPTRVYVLKSKDHTAATWAFQEATVDATNGTRVTLRFSCNEAPKV